MVRAQTTYLLFQLFQMSLLDFQLVLQLTDSLQYIKFSVRKKKTSRFKPYYSLFIMVEWMQSDTEMKWAAQLT